jgi:hypothetical protein
MIARSIQYIFVFFFLSCKAYTQNSGKVSGLLLMSPWRTDTSFDLFLPCSIDTVRSLTQNIQFIKKDTSFRILVSDIAFMKEVKRLRNQSFNSSYAEYLQYTLVLPIVAEHNTALEREMDSLLDSKIYRLPYTFFGNTITEYYQSKVIYLKNIRVLKVRLN